MDRLISDWGDVDYAMPLALKYNVGLEVAEFTIPENMDKVASLAPVIREKIRQVPLIGVHAPFAELVPASRDPMVRNVARTRLQQGYELAEALGAKHMVVHTGFYPKTYSRDEWIKNAVLFWSEFLADKTALNFLHIENVYEDDFISLKEFVDLVNQAFGDDRLTICLDIGHVNANSSKSLAEWIIGCGDRIRYAHLHNNEGMLDDHHQLDKGKIDIRSVLDLLLKHSPRAAWTVETNLEGMEPSLEWLKAQGYL